MISVQSLVQLVVSLVVLGLVFWLLWWLIAYIAPPEPFRKIATVILAVAAVLVCIGLLLNLVGVPLIRFGP